MTEVETAMDGTCQYVRCGICAAAGTQMLFFKNSAICPDCIDFIKNYTEAEDDQ